MQITRMDKEYFVQPIYLLRVLLWVQKMAIDLVVEVMDLLEAMVVEVMDLVAKAMVVEVIDLVAKAMVVEVIDLLEAMAIDIVV